MPSAWANERAVSVFQQHVTAGQDPGQDQLQRVALPDDHRADLVQDHLGDPAHLGRCERLHSASTFATIDAMSCGLGTRDGV
jgi:hypothetical protein